MRGPKVGLFLVVVLSLAALLLVPNPALAYIGPGPGLEMMPYFFSLLIWMGFALGAVLLWPIQALLRRLRTLRRAPEAAKEP
jgi:hypothetical protein